MTSADPLSTERAAAEAAPWIASLRNVQNRLAAIVKPLGSEAIRGQSFHSWTIAEVLSHLGSQADVFDGVLTSGLAGTEPPGQDSMQPIWDKWAAKTPEAQVHDAVEANERLIARLEGMSADQLAKFQVKLFSIDVDAAGFAKFRLGELALHTWDVDTAVNPDAVIVPSAISLMVDGVSQFVPYFAKPAGETFRVRLITSDPTREFALSVGEAVALEPANSGEFDGTITLTSESYLLLLYGRLTPDRAMSIQAQGIGVEKLTSVFQGV